MSDPDITEANISRWDEMFAGYAWGRYPPEELVRFMGRAFPDRRSRRSMRVLEVGCGPGANLWYLAREGFAVSGIDGSAHAIATAKQRLRDESVCAEGRLVDLKIGNFARLPWPHEHFDAVIDIEAISANTPAVIQSVISEVVRVLKPQGRFFAMMFGPRTTGAGTGKLLDERTTENPTEGPLADLGTLHFFTEEEIRERFAMFSALELDWTHRSDRNGTCQIFEWLVQGSK